jgi:hypothetical protein
MGVGKMLASTARRYCTPTTLELESTALPMAQLQHGVSRLKLKSRIHLSKTSSAEPRGMAVWPFGMISSSVDDCPNSISHITLMVFLRQVHSTLPVLFWWVSLAALSSREPGEPGWTPGVRPGVIPHLPGHLISATLSRLLVSHKIPIESQLKWQPALAKIYELGSRGPTLAGYRPCKLIHRLVVGLSEPSRD